MGIVIDRRAFRQQRKTLFQGLFILESEKMLPADAERINLGLGLSQWMKDIPEPDRSASLEKAFSSILADKPNDIILDRIDILFDPVWNCDIMKLLLSIGRNRRVYIVWPGFTNGETLSYSENGWPDGHSYNISLYIDLTFVKK